MATRGSASNGFFISLFGKAFVNAGMHTSYPTLGKQFDRPNQTRLVRVGQTFRRLIYFNKSS